jgi:hypothetical protein
MKRSASRIPHGLCCTCLVASLATSTFAAQPHAADVQIPAQRIACDGPGDIGLSGTLAENQSALMAAIVDLNSRLEALVKRRFQNHPSAEEIYAVAHMQTLGERMLRDVEHLVQARKVEELNVYMNELPKNMSFVEAVTDGLIDANSNLALTRIDEPDARRMLTDLRCSNAKLKVRLERFEDQYVASLHD